MLTCWHIGCRGEALSDRRQHRRREGGGAYEQAGQVRGRGPLGRGQPHQGNAAQKNMESQTTQVENAAKVQAG